jgi:hypothetical protein
MISVTVFAPNKPISRVLLIAATALTLAVGGYSYYSLTRHSIDLFTIPNPTRGLHQQKPIPPADTPELSQQ